MVSQKNVCVVWERFGGVREVKRLGVFVGYGVAATRELWLRGKGHEPAVGLGWVLQERGLVLL